MEQKTGGEITVKLALRSVLKKIIKEDLVDIRLSTGSNFQDLAKQLEVLYGPEIASTLNTEPHGFAWICVRNRKQVFHTEVLEDGDNVMILPPLAGG